MSELKFSRPVREYYRFWVRPSEGGFQVLGERFNRMTYDGTTYTTDDELCLCRSKQEAESAVIKAYNTLQAAIAMRHL